MFSIHRKLNLALKKVWIMKITLPQVPTTPQKNCPSAIFDPPYLLLGIYPPPLSPLPLFAKPWGWKIEEIHELHICLWSLRESLKDCAFCSLSLPNTCVPCWIAKLIHVSGVILGQDSVRLQRLPPINWFF